MYCICEPVGVRKFHKVLSFSACLFGICIFHDVALGASGGWGHGMNDFDSNNLFADSDEEDADRIYSSIMDSLHSEFIDGDIPLPNKIVFLIGAPGAGKGTNTLTVMDALGISTKPVEVSSLLNTKECEKLKSRGKLIADDIVIKQIMREILKRENSSGVIIDGYPRSPVQAYFLKKLVSEYGKIYANGLNKQRFMMLTFSVSKQTSVDRQLARGRKAAEYNESARELGKPEIKVRATDVDPEAAELRYNTYKKTANKCLSILDGSIMYHDIDAEGTFDEVKARILSKLSR